MRFIRLTDPHDPMFATAMELYAISFPAHEQREPDPQLAALGCGDYHFTLIYDNDTFAGELLYWETDDFIYVEHFCMDPALRSRGLGGRALSMLQGVGKTVILEIDPPVDAVSIGRKAFYERCGYVANPYAHIHPPYRKGNAGHALVVMSRPGPLDLPAYERFSEYLVSRVMRV